MQNHRLVFVCGLHRSGTTLLTRCLAEHPRVSGFQNTGVIEDEGQFLQTVYRPARDYGGPGRFGFHTGAHLTEASPLVTEANRKRLFAEWARHWDLSCPYLLEKSPPNIIRTRFLQAMFPGAYFIVMMRHPVAVAAATQKWSWTPLSSLVEHWLVCHELFRDDCKKLENVTVLKYGRFVQDPVGQTRRLQEFIGLEPHATRQSVRMRVNEKYFARWRRRCQLPVLGPRLRRAAARLEERVNRFGYSLHDLDRLESFSLPRSTGKSPVPGSPTR